MSENQANTFGKYKQYGAYHWEIFSRDPRRHDLFTAARYQAILDCGDIRPGLALLDLGCGDGALTYLAWLRNKNGITVGVEPNRLGRELSEQKLSSMGADIGLFESSDKIPSESQDLILCADVIEHVQGDTDLLKEIYRMLKPGGRVAISTPVRLTDSPTDPEHVREYSPEEFRGLVGSVFQVSDQRFSSSVRLMKLYLWAPRILFHRPIIGWLMSLINICTGKNALHTFDTTGQKCYTQVVVATKTI